MTKPIRGKVAAVFNDREIAVNIGSTEGVSVGMLFDVMSLETGDIIDPDTTEVLGSIERTKVRVVVTEVHAKFSVTSAYQSMPGEKIDDHGLAFGPLARALMPSDWITRYEPQRTFFSYLYDLESDVQVGDPVRQVLKERDAKAELENVNS